MAILIVLRLIPEEPVNGATFTSFLQNGPDALRIEAFDVSFGKPLGGDSIGSAVFVPDVPTPGGGPPSTIPAPTSGIAQHRRVEPPPNPPALPSTTVLKAVATAVIVVNRPPSDANEYVDPDIILKVTRGPNTVATIPVDYNVAVIDTGAAPVPDPVNYPTLEAVAGFIQLVDPTRLQPGDASVTLPKDGTPPSFADLLSAVRAVMERDPGLGPPTPAAIAAITPAQARHIAFEIGWNRHIDALPDLDQPTLEDVYTLPSASSSSSVTIRQQFEADRQIYRVSHDAQSEALVKYVFALAASFAAEKLSLDGSSVGFTFPVVPGETLSGKIKDVKVTLAES
jgi:hypothetical protein